MQSIKTAYPPFHPLSGCLAVYPPCPDDWNGDTLRSLMVHTVWHTTTTTLLITLGATKTHAGGAITAIFRCTFLALQWCRRAWFLRTARAGGRPV
jgi:hypothetical protein